MIYGPTVKPNPPDNQLISYTLIFLSAFIILYISYIKSFKTEIHNFFHLLNANLRNLNHTGARNIESYSILQKHYIDKFLNLKCTGALESINCLNKTYISHKFFRIIEYTVAECLINMAHEITTRKNNNYSNLKYKMKIEDIIRSYSRLYVNKDENNRKDCLLSLLIKIIHNMCYIHNINNYLVIRIFEDIFTRRFGIVLGDILEQIHFEDSYNIFEHQLNFWTPQLMINLKHLRKLNFIILNL